ncbi:MAG: alpha/beta fold hydrolase [Deltaproteobacteria bacterium]|nr:alpha/beta fold hydrolase [Deltaproteobacteria bacterium]
MADISQIDYRALDRPEILNFLFYPRREDGPSGTGGTVHDLRIPVEGQVTVGARLHHAGEAASTILFFHGNGEIVADYDDLGPLYVRKGINFLPVDYRGYGRSTGTPTVTAMMRDCHTIFAYVRNWLAEEGYTGPVIVMGRSLGSASALELAAHYRDRIAGLIIESGFAYLMPLLRLIGVSPAGMGITEEDGSHNIEKIRTFDGPTLIIHAQFDQIIPLSDGEALYEASAAEDKRLLVIPGADHNTIFIRGFQEYMVAIGDFLARIVG